MFWALIVEKAFAKLNGCYEHIESGHVGEVCARGGEGVS
jgi:hypothetical protein